MGLPTSIRKKVLKNGVEAAAFNSTTQTFDPMDITNHSGCGVQLDITGGAVTGTAKLQWSINGTVWEDVPASLASTITIAASTSYYMQGLNLQAALVMVSVTSTNATPMTVKGTMIGKLF